MIHMHFHTGRNTWSTREARLCGFSPVAPSESIRGPNRINQNQTLSNAIALFDNQFTRGEHAELNQRSPADRAMFKALLVSGMIPNMNAATLQDQTRGNINAADPFNLAQAADLQNPTPAELEAAGGRVRSLLTREQIDRIFPGQGALPASDLGQVVFDRVRNGRSVWVGEGNMQRATNDQLTLFLQLPIEAYKNARNDLDRVLRENRIMPPGIEAADGPAPRTPSGFPDIRLSRTKYLSLLAIMLQGGTLRTRVTGAAVPGNPQQTVQALDAIIAANAAIVNKVQDAYQVISIDEMGSTEALSGWGITLGTARTRYIEMRRRPRSVPVMQQQPNPRFGMQGQPQFIQVMQTGIPEQALTNSLPSASVWRSRPQLALDFLSANMPQTADNQRFLNALRTYIGNNWTGGPVSGLSVEDTRSILDITINALVNAEETENRTVAQTESLRKSIGLSQTIHNFAGEMKDIVMDWRNNLPAAAAVGLGAFLAIKGLHHYFFKRNRTNLENFILLPAVFGGLVYGLVQERRTGSAWWDGIAKGIQDWRNGPESTATLTNYWAQELESNDLMSRKLLAILQDQKVNDVIRFYDLMKSWEINGSRPGEQPPLPPTMNFTGFDFGQMGPREKGQAMYALLKKFFTNRGRSIDNLGFRAPGHRGGAEAQGAAYIRDRYDTPQFFSRIVTGQIRPYGVAVDGSILQQWGQPHVVRRLRELGESRAPNERRTFVYLVSMHEAYRLERENPSQGYNYKIWEVFLFEADDSTLENMSRNGREAASLVQRIRRHMQQILDRNNPLAAPPSENAQEFNLLNQNDPLRAFTAADYYGGGNFANFPNMRVREADEHVAYLNQSWNRFLGQMPLTNEARRSLQRDWANRVAASGDRTVTEVANELEQRKYQIMRLAAHSQNSERLNKEVTAGLLETATPEARLNWWGTTLITILNSLPTVAGRVITTPPINSLADVGTIRLPHSNLQDIQKRAAEISSIMQRFRRLPPALGNAGTIPTVAGIEGLDRQLAQLFSNEIMRAYLTRHVDPPSATVTPVPVLEMQVSENERKNIRQFIDDIFNRMVPEASVKRLEEAEKKITSVQNAFNIPGATFRVTYEGGSGNMRIVMNTGTLSSTENDPWTGLTFQQFMDLPEADIVQQWKVQAVARRQAELRAHAGGDPTFVAAPDGSHATYNIPGPDPAIARTPLAAFLTATTDTLVTRYITWAALPVPRREDPLAS